MDDPGLPGPLFLRYSRNDRGRPVVTELYLDGRGNEIRSGALRELDLAGVTAWAVEGDEWLEGSARLPGADLSRLASHYATGFGTQARHWVAESMAAQVRGSGVRQAPFASDPKPVDADPPQPVPAPIDGLTDDFMRAVASNYAWAARTGQRPAPMIAQQTSASVRTVHSWIRKARERGFLAPTTRGRVG